MEGKSIFVVTQETQMCGETFYSAIAAYHNEEDAKKKMKEVSKNDLSSFEEHVSKEHIDVEEHEHAIYINVGFSDEYSYTEIKQTTLY
jgi:hypothetical protein